MPIVFPSSPIVGQVFTSGGRSWVWTGSVWDSPARDNPPLAIPQGNVIINGGFDIWQRGTSFTNIGLAYSADRWTNTLNPGPNLTNTRVSGPNANIQYAMRLQVTSAPTNIVEIASRQPIERQQMQNLAGKVATLSFWYRSNRVGTHGARIIGDVQNVGGIGSLTGFEVSAANTWQRYTFTSSAFANITSWTGLPEAIGTFVDIGFRVGGQVGFTSLNANDYFEVTGVQLEEGTVATPFKRNAPSIGAELAACQRYYFRLSGPDLRYIAMNQSRAGSGFTLGNIIGLPATMRAIPSISINNLAVEPPAGGTVAITTTATNYSTVNNIGFWTTRVSGTWATGEPGMLVLLDSTSFVQASAEL